jgi:phytoene dehydrogenase-like protein
VELALSMEHMEHAFQDAKAGKGSDTPFSDGCIPSVLDRTLAPEGIHVMSLFTQWVPQEWAAQPHRDELETYADRVVDAYTELAPNFKGSILHRQVIGPWRMEHEYGLVGGNIFHGELSASQLFHTRPAAGYADYRTPIRGLYQAGSGTHGGGGVTGIPGRNVVTQIRRDLRADQLRRRLRLGPR